MKPVDPNDERAGKIDRRARHEFGDTRYRLVRYKAVATSRFREYFEFKDETAGGVQELDFTRTSPESEPVIIPSSARPIAPKVRYVVPAFKWTRTEPSNTDVRVSTRAGVLRVFMERTWFSSGDDERLGVVLAAASTIPEVLKPYVTQWANDPVRVTSPLWPVYPAQANFPAAIVEECDTVPLEELEDQSVFVASHRVQYDEQRRLWFCDIEVKTDGAYFPFVRLALARCQPSKPQAPRSLKGVELSGVVLTDLVQVVPERTASVRRLPQTGKTETLEVIVRGNTYSRVAGSPDNTRSRIEVTAEWADSNIASDLAWMQGMFATVATTPLSNFERLANPPILWKGAVTPSFLLPPPPRRIVVKEWESLSPDPAKAGAADDDTRRLVYAEHFDIAPGLAPQPDIKGKP